MTAVVDTILLMFPGTNVVVEANVEDEFVRFVDFEDQELQVSQPSAERIDNRQQDQRFPLHKPV